MAQDGTRGGAISFFTRASIMSVEHRKATRARMRRRRRSVKPDDAAAAARSLCDRLTACDFYRAARHIAAYVANDGEIDTRPVIEAAWRDGKSVYLPVLQPGSTLAFARHTDAAPLRENRYGIPEPRTGDTIATGALDVVLVPLVAFDDELFRIGMGGGYYDRTFAALRQPGVSRPRLVGLAFEFQRVESITPATWDVPLWRVVTDAGLHQSDKV